MIRRALLTFAFVTSIALHPCQGQIKDSMRYALSFKPKTVFGLNTKVSMVSGDPARTVRLFVGLEYHKKVRFELGYNYMPNATVSTKYDAQKDTLTFTNKLAFWGFEAEYTFYNKQRWKLSYPIQVGIGSNAHTMRINNDLQEARNEVVFPIELGVNSMYYFYDWIAVKAGMGVRMSFGQSFTTLSGPYYNLGIALYAGALYRTIKSKI